MFEKFLLSPHDLAYYLVPVLPPRVDGSPIIFESNLQHLCNLLGRRGIILFKILPGYDLADSLLGFSIVNQYYRQQNISCYQINWCENDYSDFFPLEFHKITLYLLDFVKVLLGVLVGHVRGGNVQLEVRPEVLEVVVVGQLVGDVRAQRNGCLVGPTPVKSRVFIFKALTFN